MSSGRASGQAGATLFRLIGGTKPHHLEPLACLINLFSRPPATPMTELPQFLPNAWPPHSA